MFKYKEGEPCEHIGCLNHKTHPCENCGRINGSNTFLQDRGCRWYNGIPSNLMNQIYDGLVDRYGSIEELQTAIPNWATFSLYLARTCGVIERNNNEKR